MGSCDGIETFLVVGDNVFRRMETKMRLKVILGVLALAALVMPVISESVSVGPYVISFDFENAISDYSIEILAENKTIERYDGSYFNQNAISIRGPEYPNDSTADYTLVLINRIEDPWYVDPYSLKSDIEGFIDYAGYLDIKTYPRSIDGYDTFLGVGTSPWKQTLYYTEFYPNCIQRPDSDYCVGNIKIAIYSVKSWDAVAPLLRTIHVELPDTGEEGTYNASTIEAVA